MPPLPVRRFRGIGQRPNARHFRDPEISCGSCAAGHILDKEYSLKKLPHRANNLFQYFISNFFNKNEKPKEKWKNLETFNILLSGVVCVQ